MQKNDCSGKENFIDDMLPDTGTYDDGYLYARSLIVERHHEIMDQAFLRENLLKAHAEGKQKVIRMVHQYDEQGREVMVCIEDYFMESEASKDVFMVCFFQVIHADEFVQNIYD